MSAVVAAVSGLGAVLAAISAFSGQVKGFLGIFAEWEVWQLAVTVVALSGLGLWFFLLSRQRRSILLRPEALRLERDNPDHLIGRAEDIDRLLARCREEPLVFLEGESGAGKSALLRTGLLPGLIRDTALLPIYVPSMVGRDWDRDPRRFVAAALWEALTSDERTRLKLEVAPPPATIMQVLDTIPTALGRTPLLLLDQFDDYQTRHLDRFLVENSWLKPDKLALDNPFWADLRQRLAGDTLRCLIATRLDNAGGLTSVRFGESVTFRLGSLPTKYVAEVIGQLIDVPGASKVVADPDRGWTALVGQLTNDLERGGTVLPQQLKIVLAGLGTLPRRVMTVAAYDRAGRVSGLEARFIEECVNKVAALRGLTPDTLRAVLLGMVDPNTGLKTVEQSLADLRNAQPGAESATLEQALDDLIGLEVVRQRVDPSTAAATWLLDHDYLARAVREADRRAHRWTRTLADGAEAAARAAGSWSLWWRALLPPRTQRRFWLDRVRGRFRYGAYRRYAIASLVRFAPHAGVVAVLLVLGGFEYGRIQQRNMEAAVDRTLNELVFESDGGRGFRVELRDAEALLALRSLSDAAMDRALSLLLTDPSRLRVFVRHPDRVLHALIGTSLARRTIALAMVTSRTASTDPRQPGTTRDAVLGLARVATYLENPGVLQVTWWLDAIAANKTDRSALLALGRGLSTLAGRLTEAQAKTVIPIWLDAIAANKTDRFTLQALGDGLSALAGRLTEAQAKTVVPIWLDAIAANKTDAFVLLALGGGLSALAGRLTEDQAKTVVQTWLDAIAANKTAPYALEALGGGLSALAGRPTEAQAKAVIPIWLDAFAANKTDPSALQALGGGLSALAGHLTEAQAKTVVQTWLDAIAASKTDPSALQALGGGLSALAGRLTEAQAKDVAAASLDVMRSARDPDLVGQYAEIRVAAVAGLTQRQRIARILHTLDHPLLPPKARTSLIDTMGKQAQPAQSFDGRFWAGLDWVATESKSDGTLNGILPVPATVD